MTACATIASDQPGRVARHQEIDARVAPRTEHLETSNALAKTGVSFATAAALFDEAFHRSGLFRKVVGLGEPYDALASFRIISVAREPDSLENVKVYGTVLSGLLLSPLLRYHDTITVVGELELRVRERIVSRYVAKGSAVLSRTVFETARFSLDDSAVRAAIQSVSGKLIDSLREDAGALRALGQRDGERAVPAASLPVPAWPSQSPACLAEHYWNSVAGRCTKVGE